MFFINSLDYTSGLLNMSTVNNYYDLFFLEKYFGKKFPQGMFRGRRLM